MKLQPTAKKTVTKIAAGCIMASVIMVAVFVMLHFLSVHPFSYTVILGAAAGTGVAILNFVLMCLTIQAAAEIEDKKRMRAKLQLSYNGRMILQAGWVVAAFFIPCFQPVAAALPLLFPTVVILVLRRSGKLVDPITRKNEQPEDPSEEEQEV